MSPSNSPVVASSSRSSPKRPLPSDLSSNAEGPSEKRTKTNNIAESSSNNTTLSSSINDTTLTSSNNATLSSSTNTTLPSSPEPHPSAEENSVPSIEKRDSSASENAQTQDESFSSLAAVPESRSSSPSTLDHGKSPEPGVLGESSRSKLVPFPKDGELKRLEVRVKASECELEYKSRTRYHGDVYLHLDHISTQPFHCGFIDGFVVDKDMASTQGSGAKEWIREWLKPRMTGYKDADEEMAAALRLCYKANGAPKCEDGPGPEDTVVFIELVSIKPETTFKNVKVKAEGQSLLKHLFELYFQCLTEPQMPCANSLTDRVFIVLEPGLPSDPEVSKRWNRGDNPDHLTGDEYDKLLVSVADTLEGIYSSPAIGFRTIAKDKPVAGTLHTAMVRQIDRAVMKQGILWDGG